jgi:phosphoribosylanthranilate isomerase
VPEFTSHRSFIKICGVTTLEDADLVVSSGASAIGVILTDSRRRIDLERAAQIVERVDGQLVRVAVVRGSEQPLIDEVLEHLDIDVVQVHGEMSADLLARLRRREVGVIKALSVGSDELDQFEQLSVDALLIDGPIPGSGESHSWKSLTEHEFQRPVIGAGGLNATNVAGLIDHFGVWGVDVASGVESSPGVKDPRRVLDFVATARRHFELREETGD